MDYVTKPLKGIFNTSSEFIKVKEKNEIIGLTKNVLIISFINIILISLIAYFSSDVQKSLIQADIDPTSNIMFFIFIGTAFFGGIIPIITITSYSVLTWILFTEISFRKIFLIHCYVYTITLISLSVQLIYFFIFNIDPSYPPLSLNIISDILPKSEYIQSLLGNLSIFWVWGLIIQIISIVTLSDKSKYYCIISIVILNLTLTMGITAWM